ncbi:hypothetical protein [uncultured Kiloniella sp.]|uniref:hypothetical protein n=1 Tax=uncultured Kiloniella sp. TaxID=1133091 RepID=UPI0026346015|nr:hypothetical protein [uncultured Kiloniella sp.]
MALDLKIISLAQRIAQEFNTIRGQIPPTPVFTKQFKSEEQIITSGGKLTLAHDLPTQPELYKVVLKCKTPEFGYSVGDEVDPSLWAIGTGASSHSRGCAVVPSATNIVVIIGSKSSSFNIPVETTGSTNNITNSYWRIVVKAWA